jgi:predicted  nucleic acid-binding Zn-ribbon protein
MSKTKKMPGMKMPGNLRRLRPLTEEERKIKSLQSELDKANKNLSDARESIKYYQEQNEQLRSENRDLMNTVLTDITMVVDSLTNIATMDEMNK